jgi:hypothetical protein
MRATNKMSLELIDRETDDQNFAYIVDTGLNLDDVGAELQTAIGQMLKSSSMLHEHSVDFVVSIHTKANGWPSSNHIDIKDHQIRSVCILSPLSHDRTAIEFASQLMGTPRLPVAHRTDEYAMRFLAASHEGFHCISAHRSKLDQRAKTALETISDVGAVNEALSAGIAPEYLIALADWRALRFASGISDVVAGRANGKRLYSRASPSHMSTVAINRLLARGPVNGYQEIETLALSSTPEGLYGQRKKAQNFLTRTMLLFKNIAVKKRFPNASIQDADDILSMIGAPAEMIVAVKQSVARYLSKLDCRRAVVQLNQKRETKLACKQSDGSYAFAGEAILGVSGASFAMADPIDIGAISAHLANETARFIYVNGRKMAFSSHENHHRPGRRDQKYVAANVRHIPNNGILNASNRTSGRFIK